VQPGTKKARGSRAWLHPSFVRVITAVLIVLINLTERMRYVWFQWSSPTRRSQTKAVIAMHEIGLDVKLVDGTARCGSLEVDQSFIVESPCHNMSIKRNARGRLATLRY
jgi:hypothetical protein